MKYFLTIAFVCIISVVVAQDTCRLSFTSSNGNVTDVHRKKIRAFIKGRNVTRASIYSLISTKGNISTNRIYAETRLQAVRNNLENLGIPFNRIQSNIKIPNENYTKSEVLIRFQFAGRKGSRVLKKTAIVQISEIGYASEINEYKEAIVVKEKDSSLLNIEEFKKDKKITLPNLLFETSTHFFLPGSDVVLEELADILIAKPNLKVELQGHICCRLGGTDGLDPVTEKFNLSEMRAKAVYLFLQSRGISESRMTYKGFASRNKLYPKERNQMEMMLNRRVEVLIVED